MSKPKNAQAETSKLESSKTGVTKIIEDRLVQLESALYPVFLQKKHTKTQEIIAGVALGIVFLTFIFAIVFFGVPSMRALIWGKNTSQTSTVLKPKIVSSSSLQLTLNSWRLSGGGESFKAYPGFDFVVIDVSILHKLSEPTWLAPALQSYVMDESGQQYKLTPDDEINNPLPSQEYAPGTVAKGQLAYEVPSGSRQLKWCYDLQSGTSTPNPLCIALR